MRAKSVSIGGKKVKYVVKGEGQDIIFIHGMGGSHKGWEKVIKKVSKKFKCWAISLPGYRDFKIRRYAELIEEFIKKMEIKSPYIVGHSLGGLISIDFANRNSPEKMVLVAAPLTRITPEGLRNLFEVLNEKINENKKFESFAEWFLKRIPVTENQIKKLSFHVLLKYVKGIIEQDFPFNVNKLDLKNEFMLVYGKKDSILKIIHGLDLYEEIGAEKIVIIDAGHYIPSENSNELSEIIIEFFSEKPKSDLEDIIKTSIEGVDNLLSFIKDFSSD
jgi:pimeloyl-ACP methyl ester carboxylesterase